MRIIAADDEQMGYEQLVQAIKEAAPKGKVVSFMTPQEVLEYAKNHRCEVAFLDIEMGAMSGIDVAKQLKIWHPQINIIFVTGYTHYMGEAFRMHASGYINKPVKVEDVKNELRELRSPAFYLEKEKLVAKCFGTFDVFADGKSLNFARSKTKELLAYLIDRRGNSVTSGEIRAVLWQDAETDQNTGVYLQMLKKDLKDTLRKVGMEDVFVNSWNKYAVNTERISCDLYDYLENKPAGVRAYNGEYMAQYDWCSVKDVLDLDHE